MEDASEDEGALSGIIAIIWWKFQFDSHHFSFLSNAQFYRHQRRFQTSKILLAFLAVCSAKSLIFYFNRSIINLLTFRMSIDLCPPEVRVFRDVKLFKNIWDEIRGRSRMSDEWIQMESNVFGKRVMKFQSSNELECSTLKDFPMAKLVWDRRILTLIVLNWFERVKIRKWFRVSWVSFLRRDYTK